MDKRFVTFLMATMFMFASYFLLRQTFAPPPPDKVVQNELADGVDADGEQPSGDGGTADGTDVEPDDPQEPSEPAVDPAGGDPPVEATNPNGAAATRRRTKPQWVTLGSVDPDSGYRMLVTFNNQGAVLERAELSSPHYLDLEDDTGYGGHLALTAEAGGVTVNAVGAGTPASQAKCIAGNGSAGLQVGDVLLSIDGQQPEDSDTHSLVEAAESLMHGKGPGTEVAVEVQRGESKLTYQIALGYPHLQVIQPELKTYTDKIDAVKNPKMQPLSFQTALKDSGKVNMHTAYWELLQDPSKPDEVAFRLALDAADFDGENVQPLEVIKRFRLAKIDVEAEDESESPGYHLTMSIEVRNLGGESTTVALKQRGPTGLPLEGWWYSRKGTADWGSAGARDVVWRFEGTANDLYRLPVIYDYDEALAEGEELPKDQPLFPFENDTILDYVGVDTQYFSVVMVPDLEAPSNSVGSFRFAEGSRGMTTGTLLKKWKQTTGISFELITREQTIPASESFQQQYTVFLGPKDPKILSAYGLDGTIVYGWRPFADVAKILLHVLHGIYFVVRNYGIAIILLTVFVRVLVLPIGRKQAQNAAKMQELAPEMKAIAEKHKDMEQRAKAQQALFKSHNYHPLGGCWMMFIQLPIFFGLYKALSTSIDLRQASLIPGIQWCSNLAGPDMLLRWDSFMPAFLAAENGYLGPYLNVLPLVTIGLFILQQKLFMPPATDEQTRMQQSMMKYMMIFMGFMFFKVPSGLCLYFIVSALWSVAERKLLPKPKPKGINPSGSEDKAEESKAEKPTPKPRKTKAELKENSLAAMFNKLLSKSEPSNGDDKPNGKRPKRKKKRK